MKVMQIYEIYDCPIMSKQNIKMIIFIDSMTLQYHHVLCIRSCNAAIPKYQHALITFFPFYLSNETNNEEKVLHIHPCQLYVIYCNRILKDYFYLDLSFSETVACVKSICNLQFQIYITINGKKYFSRA